MSDGAAQNGGTQAATTGEAASVAGAAVAATTASTAPAAPGLAAAVAAPAAPAAPLPAGAVPAPAAPIAPAGVAIAQPAAAQAADCVPAKPKKAHKHDKKETEEEHARATSEDEDQNLSQPADGCVLPQGGQVVAEGAAPQDVAATPVVDDGEGGGISSGLLIGAGVLAAIGVGVLALAKDGDKNGAPVATADTGAVNEGASLTGSVATNDSDPDNDPLTFALTGAAPAGLTFNTNGSFTFDANNAAYNSLAAGATQVVTIPYTVTDPDGATSSSTLTITVTGTNDAPVATAVTGPAATEGGAAVTATVAGTDPDQGAVLTYSLVNPVAGVTINSATGVVTLNPADPAYNALAAGQTQAVVANVRVADAQGASATTTVTFNVTGTNDVPVATAATAVATEGAAPPVTGTLAATDPDAGAVLTFALNAPVAGLTLNPNGTFSFDPTNAAYDNLAAGQTRNVVANFTVRDAQGGTSTSTLTITVTGTNDVPVAVADTNAGAEDTIITGSVATNDRDVDAGDTLTYTVVGTAPAGFVLNANGTYTLDAGAVPYQFLREGQEQTVSVTYQVADGRGGTATSTLTIVVTGRSEVANLDFDSDNNLNTRQVFDGSVGDVIFSDDDDVANVAVVRNFGADDILIFDAPFNGAGRVSFANIDFDGDGIANDLAITTNKGGVVSDIILRDALSAAAAGTVISTEAAAEAAIGAGFNNFRSSTESATPVAVSLDVDNDSNLTSRFTLPVAANTNSFAFTDDAAIGNTVLVNDFGADDSITFNSAQANVSFGSGDFDNDGVADDLRITTNTGGVVSDIILANAVAANVVVFDEATAEAAVGPGVDNFGFNGTVAPPPPPPPVGTTTQSLDVDNDASLITARVFDAGTDGFRFTDDADIANTTVIVNLGANDRIILETGNVYSFTNSDTDNDGLANDLIVTLNKGGVVSELVIKNVVSPDAFVSNEAQAEAALGNIDYFQFA